MLSSNCNLGWQTPTASVLLPGVTAVPWPLLPPQPTAAVGTRGSQALTSSYTKHGHKIDCPCTDIQWQTTQTPLPAWAPRLGFLQRSPHIYAVQINQKEQGNFCHSGINPKCCWWHPYRWGLATSQNRVVTLPLMDRSGAEQLPRVQESETWPGLKLYLPSQLSLNDVESL